MAERSLRGMKIGANSLESDVGVAFVERREEKYHCTNNHDFMVTFVSEAEAPLKWECKCGASATLVGQTNSTEEEKPNKPVRTHWDMLLERRSPEELQVILDERLKLLRAGKLFKNR